MDVVFITSRYPYPINKGDKLRVYHQLKSLSSHVNIHLIALTNTDISSNAISALQPYCKSINIFKISLLNRAFSMLFGVFKMIPLQVSFFYSHLVSKKIGQLVTTLNPNHIHCHLIRTAEYVKDIKGISKSLDYMDAFGIGMHKRELSTSNPILKFIYRLEKSLLYKYESSALEIFDSHCIISEQDKLEIPNPNNNFINVIPNGVDFATFYPKELEKKYDLVFMGNMSYPPNVFAIKFFVNEVMSTLIEAFPEIQLLIAGNGASKEIKKFQNSNVSVIEHFEDISESIALAKIMIAPMFISIGLQNKIIQSMAMKVPVVASSSANNAINAENGVHILEANNANEFCNKIKTLLTDNNQLKSIADNGYTFVKKNFEWEMQNQKLLKMFGEI